jgi:hypothetical protein
MINQAIESLFSTGQTVELRVPKAGKLGTISGYFNNPAALASAAEMLSGKYPGIYVTLNPADDDLLSRTPNRVTNNAHELTKDANITHRRWLPVDADPVRPADVSSSDAEHNAALDLLKKVAEEMAFRGWPDPVFADSGNGAHLLYPINEPNDEETKKIIHGVLKRLAAEFDTDTVKIDIKVGNASRIWKLYGTMSCKGENTPDRPHRRATIISNPGRDSLLSRDQMAQFQPVPDKPEQKQPIAQPAKRGVGYASAALASAISAIASALPGTRNDVLNRECFGIAQLVAGGEINEQDAWCQIESSALGAGLDPAEVSATMRSAFNSGSASPRVAPEPKHKPRQITTDSVDPETGEVIGTTITKSRSEYESEIQGLHSFDAISPHMQAIRADTSLSRIDRELLAGMIAKSLKTGGVNLPISEIRREIGMFDRPRKITTGLESIDTVTPLPYTNKDGAPTNTIENLAEILRRIGIIVRYNVISKDIEILIPGESYSLDNRANGSLASLMSYCNHFGFSTSNIGDYICLLADQNPYNPVATWITSIPWDGVGRIDQLCATIVTHDEYDSGCHHAAILKKAMITRWLLSAVSAVFNDNGVSAAGVLVLQGAQYLGKTKWFKGLAPQSLGVIQDGLSLRPDDRDSVKQVISYWMVELGELDATFRKADIAALKSFITRDKDTIRRAYARLESTYARRTVFFASVNPRQFLHDPTGNRRYWTLSCRSINHDHGIDMQQMWAEIYETLYKSGHSIYLTEDELGILNDKNQDHEETDPIRDRLTTKLAWDEPRITWRWITATDILAECGFDRPSQKDATRCGEMVAEMNGGHRKRSNGKKLLLVPSRVQT